MDVTLVWLAPEAPSDDARHALDEWARARGMRLALPTEEASASIPVDLAVTDRVEEELDRARDALATLDLDGAERALASAEQDLLDHPELPQGAWQMAEVMRAWASRWLRGAPDTERAARAWRAAAALDGGRLPGLGEPRGVERAPVVTARLALDGADGARALVDGAVVTEGVLRVAPGRHQLVVTRAGRVVWASWVNVTADAEVRAAVPSLTACSRADIGQASLGADGTVHADGVRCARWAAALPEAGGVRVASCELSSCGPMLSWRVALPEGPPGGHAAVATTRWPAWATWALVGAGVATGTLIGLAAAGTFQSKSETRFVTGGVRTQTAPGIGFSF